MRQWAREQVIAHHYLHTAPDPRTRAFCYAIALDAAGGRLVGCLWFGRPEATSCFRGRLTFGSQADVARGRAAYDRWEILNLSRVWLNPSVQHGGVFALPGVVPGFTDRKDVFRPTLASAAILRSLQYIGADYLTAHPPCFVEEPYQIRAVLSYCNTRLHRGTIYRASGFELARVNGSGIETWWTPAVAPLSARRDREIRALAEWHPRSQRLRAEREKRKEASA
jgi:hypothetical protein